MGEWVHRLLEADPETGQVVCKNCGPVKGYRSPTGKFGMQCGRRYWDHKYDERRKRGRQSQSARMRKKQNKKDHCEKCGWVPDDPCQLEVDHIDGNPRNNRRENHQTLCANCHRLKTYRPDLWARNTNNA